MDLPLDEAFRAFGADPRRELDGALLVSRIVRPHTDSAWCQREITRLAERLSDHPSAEELVTALRQEGFAGASDYYEAENSAIDYVLRERHGIPISLAVVVLAVAEQCGVQAQGINFPGHFLIAFDGQLADPYTLTLIDEDDRRERLASCGTPPALALRPATPIDLTMRMLNNLRGLAVARGDHLGAITLTDYQLIIAPDPFAIHLARIELWNALGAATMVHRELERAIAVAPSPPAKQVAEAALQRLRADAPTLH
ncbi:MAG: transglutaminase family protein [Gammaproteobacteria bacterium]